MRFTIFLMCIVTLLVAQIHANEVTTTSKIRFGIIGTDTSHAVQFAKILKNNPTLNAEITHAYKGGSPDISSSIERVEKFASQLESEYGVQMVNSIPDLISEVDAVLLESVDGRTHLEQVRPVFAAKKPVFIDKPFAGNLKDALAIARLANETKTPCFSSSSLRFYAGISSLKNNSDIGDITGVSAYSPCTYEEHHPDLFWYGIHGVEILYTLMETGCETVSRHSTADYDLVTGTWADGRIGTFRGIRKGKSAYGALVYGTKNIEHSAPVTGDLYKPLVEEIVQFIRTGKAPVSMETTIEMMAFMEAADESKRLGGAPVSIKDVIKKATD